MSLEMIFKLAAGVGLFLFGMKTMSEGLEKAAGTRLRRLLNLLVRNRFVSVVVGTVFTMIVQSSSATTVMVVSFVSAGLLTLAQSVGVILGANIGTTITAWLVAINLTAIAPLLLAAGVVMVMFITNRTVRRIGVVVLGFGMLFFGMSVMSDAVAPLKENPQIAAMLISFDNPFLALLMGVAVTCLIHSSSASIGLLQVLALQLGVPLDICIYVVLGCNIGTCIDAILAGIAGSKDAKRAAMVHLSFNVLGALFTLLIMQLLPFTGVVRWLGGLLGGNVMVEISVAHTLFNVLGTAIFLPFVKPLLRFVTWIVPGKDRSEGEMHLQFLSDAILKTPPAAVESAKREAARMATMALDNLKVSMKALLSLDESSIKQVTETEKTVNFLNHTITEYLIRISQLKLSPIDSHFVGSLFHIVNDIERIGDHAENMAEFATQRIESDMPFTQDGKLEIERMFEAVSSLVEGSIELLTSQDEDRLPAIHDAEEAIDDMEKELQQLHIDRLARGECDPRASMVFSDVLSNLERVADHATNVAFLAAERPKGLRGGD